jgi:signal transduction histidine kinase
MMSPASGFLFVSAISDLEFTLFLQTIKQHYQVHGVQARSHEGSGIGLALVHELVQL